MLRINLVKGLEQEINLQKKAVQGPVRYVVRRLYGDGGQWFANYAIAAGSFLMANGLRIIATQQGNPDLPSEGMQYPWGLLVLSAAPILLGLAYTAGNIRHLSQGLSDYPQMLIDAAVERELDRMIPP